MEILKICYNLVYFGFLDFTLNKLSCGSVYLNYVDKNDTIKQIKLQLILTQPAILVYIFNVLYAILFLFNQNCMKWHNYQYKLMILGCQYQYIPSQKYQRSPWVWPFLGKKKLAQISNKFSNLNDSYDGSIKDYQKKKV